MSLLDQNNLTRDLNFQSRIKMAAINTAIMVINESPQTANHDLRYSYATRVLSGNVTFLTKLSYLVVTSKTLSESSFVEKEISDDDIQNVVNSIWDILSIDGK